MVAWQFTAWNMSKKRTVPSGYGVIGSEGTFSDHLSTFSTPHQKPPVEDDDAPLGLSEPKLRFDCLTKRMSRIACLVAVSVLLAGTLFSQDTLNLVTFDRLLASPQSYLGQAIAVHGVVDQSEGLNGFKLIEAKSPAGSEKAPSLRATWIAGARMVPLQNGGEAIAIGQIQNQDNAPILRVANVITDKDAIRRFIRPSERRPRPGDNLGHDAQPSKWLSD